MEEELFALINRTELAAQRAEAAGFHDTAQALRTIVATLMKPNHGSSQIQSIELAH